MNEIRNIIIGFELGEKESQICYYDRKAGEAGSAGGNFPVYVSHDPE